MQHLVLYVFLCPLVVSSICVFFPEKHYSSEPLHSVIESFGACISLIVAYLLTSNVNARLHGLNDNECYFIRLALCSMGGFDLIHAMVNVGNNFVWFHSLAVFLGGFFSLIFLSKTLNHIAARTTWGIALFLIVVIGGSIIYPNVVPKMTGSGEFSIMAKMLNICGSFGYLMAAIY